MPVVLSLMVYMPAEPLRQPSTVMVGLPVVVALGAGAPAVCPAVLGCAASRSVWAKAHKLVQSRAARTRTNFFIDPPA